MQQRAKLGSEHPNTLLTMNNLAFACQAAGKLDKALPLFEEAATGIPRIPIRNWFLRLGNLYDIVDCDHHSNSLNRSL